MKILLIDGLSILNRAFYALPLLSNRDGEYTNAVFGFMTILLRFINEEQPDYVTVAFDLPQPTFRHEEYGAYKGTRKGMPDELREQVPTLKNLLELMDINIAECPGFEADDVIGTLAAKATAQGLTPVIISGDRDLLQLATDTVLIRLPKTKAGKTEVEDYHAADVLAKYGVSPQAFIDVKALMGDTSDNVPGVPSIGEKTATKIIMEFGSLDNALANVSQVKPPKAAQNLAEFKDQAILSRKLVTIVTDAPVDLTMATTENMWCEKAQEEVKRLELKSLYKYFPQAAAAPPQDIEYEIITERDKVQQLFASLPSAAFYIVWGEAGAVSIAVTTATATYYIPTDSGELSLDTVPGLSPGELLEMAKPWLESDHTKILFDYKECARLLHRYGISLRAPMDTMLAAYLLDPMASNRLPTDAIFRYTGIQATTIDELLDNKGKRGKTRRTEADIPLEALAKVAVGYSHGLYNLHTILLEELEKADQLDLYSNIEMPTAHALLDMEIAGIQVDPAFLTAYGEILNSRITELTAEIHQLAGEEFNINSPAQLGVILFEKLGLTGGKKNATGYSTAADVLDKIRDKHIIVPLVQEYRAHAKLKSTYVDGLLPLIKNVRIHSHFNQALTATGRLSSAEPNLQNIPVRMPLGRELRKAFVPREGHVFVDADYSQIELRLLAHMSGDETLVRAFHAGEDIHRLTASQVLGISQENVTAEERNAAKSVNFGIIYGMGAFGLSADINVSVREAEAYINAYFRQYPGVKQYMDNTISRAKETGYVATLYNRRRQMPELKSGNFNTRAFGERVAMNMPLQGTAADIIKIAMVNVTRRLKAEGLQAQLILQVHDELLLEVPKAEVAQVTDILKFEMENAASLAVPLVADVNVGNSWYDTKK